MPIFDFRCTTCGHVVEEIRRSKDDAPKCPTCGAKMVAMVGKSSFVLNGTCWASDGYSGQ